MALETNAQILARKNFFRDFAKGLNGPSDEGLSEIRLDTYYSFVKKLADAFESEKLDYAFTGALAVSYYGVPRTTTDVDVIVDVRNQSDDREKIIRALKRSELKVDERKIDNAFTSGYKIATFKSEKTPYTLDLILSQDKLDKKPGKIGNALTFFQSPESLIASKFRMIKATLPPERATKDKDDVKAILAFTKVDIEEIKKQAQKDKTLEIFKELIV